jgi:hypothetical protein
MDYPPDFLAGFGREAIRPYLNLSRFMSKEGRSYAQTQCWSFIREDADKNWAVALLVLGFRNGIHIVKSFLWKCYDGEGKDGLDEEFDGGQTIMMGTDEKALMDLLSFCNESETALAQPDITDKLDTLQLLHQKYIAPHQHNFQAVESLLRVKR